MAESIIKRKTNNPIKSKQVSSGMTINANGGYNYVLDVSLAGKNFQGYQIGGIAGKNVTVGQVYIDSAGAYIVIINNSNVNITTGAISFYYTD